MTWADLSYSCAELHTPGYSKPVLCRYCIVRAPQTHNSVITAVAGGVANTENYYFGFSTSSAPFQLFIVLIPVWQPFRESQLQVCIVIIIMIVLVIIVKMLSLCVLVTCIFNIFGVLPLIA